MEKGGVVPMRLFANWEMDRASSSVVQSALQQKARIIPRLPCSASCYDICILVPSAMDIQYPVLGNKRSLRSNDIVVTPYHGRVDLDLDISFTIQYPHFVKRKGNTLQILIQRRRRYKNRPFPSSFKTIAVGMVNLTQLLQHGGLREIPLWSSEADDKQSSGVQSIGRLNLVTCQSQPLEIDMERDRVGKKQGGIENDLSEDDSDSDYEDVPGDSDINEPTSARNTARGAAGEVNLKTSRATRKNNIRQRFVTLLKKFKVPEEEGIPSRSASAAMVPTDKELQDLFEELENMSDSGPEMAADEISIGSNPRPGLRPFFTRSKEILPAIYDREGNIIKRHLFFKDAENGSDSEGEAEDLDWSSETEKERDKDEIKISQSQDFAKDSMMPTLTPSGEHMPTTNTSSPAVAMKPQLRVASTSSAPLVQSTSLGGISHSLTTGSISKKAEKDRTVAMSAEKNVGVSEQYARDGFFQLSTLLSAYPAASAGCWLCSYSDLPHLSTISVPTVNCPSGNAVKQAIGQIVNRILNLSVLFHNQFLSMILRAYVECLHHKSSSNWLHYLRFAIIPAPHSLIAKLIEGLDVVLDHLSRDMWERWAEISPAEKQSITEKMNAWLTTGGACLNLPIGEALLQMTERGQEADACRVFVPFLAEVRVGQSSEDEEATCMYSSPRSVEIEKEYVVSARDREYSAGLSSSPPNSPHIRSDAHEMHVEYWLGRDPSNENVNVMGAQSLTPNSKKDLCKGSMKATFRTLVITRTCNQPLLLLSFVKEKRKEKMLQKLGMKKGQKSENENPPVQVAAVSRLLCSGASKHSDLTDEVDVSEDCSFESVLWLDVCSLDFSTGVLVTKPGIASEEEAFIEEMSLLPAPRRARVLKMAFLMFLKQILNLMELIELPVEEQYRIGPVAALTQLTMQVRRTHFVIPVFSFTQGVDCATFSNFEEGRIAWLNLSTKRMQGHART
ncbi:hypothetical protein ANCCEY_07640 [Ancylostoma ceylanicum]|uniref:Phosphofurin acidic cluster sorting protein 2 n=1 Tax=Ancylostoma ceylanicum TaxID=53326 RepID=A0A0D6LMH5_9BILA|nr:hypothetical protein ANCCEY_07640 [Ancylostoma ceylanicum]